MFTAKVLGFLGAVGLLPVVAQIDAASSVERMGKGTAQMVLAVVVIALALALLQVFKLHRKDAIDSRKELKDEFERHASDQKADNESLQKIVADNTSAMNMLAKSDEQLKDAIYHLAQVVDKNGETAEQVRKT